MIGSRHKYDMRSPETTLRAIQEEYFELLQSNPLISACEQVGDAHVRIPDHLLATRSQIVLATSQGLKPAAMDYVERLFDEVHTFWTRRQRDLETALAQLQNRCIHVDDTAIDTAAKKYGILFDALLVSDQILQERSEFIAADRVPEWKNLVVNVIQTVFRYLSLRDIFLPANDPPVAYVVPAQMCLSDKHYLALNHASNILTCEFFSQMLNQPFAHLGEYFDHCKRRKITEDTLEQSLLRQVFHRQKATDLPSYGRSIAGLIQREQGVDWWQREPIGRVMAFDISARFREFERFAADAYHWEQEPEIPELDIPMFDWWFEHSAKHVASALGASYSEDFLSKAAVQSAELDFVRGIEIDELLVFRRDDGASRLREDLSLCRANIRRTKQGNLNAVVQEAGQYVQSRLTEFDAKIASRARRSRLQTAKEAGKLAYSTAVTIVSAVFPPLSALSLLWGGTVADLHKAEKERQHPTDEILARPLSTLAAWKKRSDES